MWERLRPDEVSTSVFDIDYSALRKLGMRGIIFDLDNTLVEWGKEEIDPRLPRLARTLSDLGFVTCILSNSLKGRIGRVSNGIGIQAAPKGIKPLPWSYHRALRLLGTSPQETVLVGDQVFTDVLGGNLAGLRTILVRPLGSREFFTTRFFRHLERRVLDKLGLDRD